MKTPTNRKSQGDGVEQEKTSGKKLVQARLPFKILSTPEGVVAAKDSTEARKRKLSYEEEDSAKSFTTPQSTKRRSLRTAGNEASTKKRKEIINGSAVKKTIIANVVLSDSNDSADGGIDGNANDSGCKGNSKPTEKRNPLTKVGESSDVLSDDVELIESTDEDEKKITEKSKVEAATEKVATSKKHNEAVTTTPLSNKKSIQKKSRKSNTPQSANKSNVKSRKSAGDANSATKLQIKLPISSKKNKRRKQTTKTIETVDDEQNMHDDLSDDVEIISKELHPEKRQKLDIPSDGVDKEQNKEKEISEIIKQSIAVDKENTTDVEIVEEVPTEVNEHPKAKQQTGDSSKIQAESKNKSSTTPTDPLGKQLESEDAESENEQNISKTNEVSSTSSDLEADTEAETTVNSERCHKTRSAKNASEMVVIDNTASPKITSDSSVHKIQKKNLTPKQQKLLEQRHKAREEKERKIQEERLQKQREKEERESAKKREREEKEEHRRKEREEKEEQRRKEREEKERKRLADIEVKNEEKRKRNEAKEEEQRKKDDERKRKEQEKEEVEMKKKKAAMAFTKFFSRPMQDTTAQRTGEKDVTEENHQLLAFRPFQIKGDMKLAPIVRKMLTDEEREQLTTFIEEKSSTKAYLDELKCGTIKPYKWSPPAQNDNERIESKQGKDEDDDEVVLVEDELERAGQAIIEEHNVPIERYRAKFYKFAENRRPPYFGTWRKKSKIITARRPFAHDKQFFDYEVDSDDEWEEEEPGESLDGSDDDKEKESEDEDYEVDNEWFVPHGHLSEEEMQNEDDLGDNNDREAQKAKLKILQQEFAKEMKKKTEKIKPRLIGCIWVDENGNQPELCPKIIWDSLNMHAILCAEPPIMEEIKLSTENHGENNIRNAQTGEKSNCEIKLKPITLNESMLKQLVKLVHCNTHSKNFLIKEFIAYIEANEESVRNGDMRGPLKSTVRERIDEFAQWQVVEEISNNNENTKDNNKSTKTQKNKKKLCWVVSKDILQKMDVDTNDLNNNWEYILQPRVRPRAGQKEDTALKTIDNHEDSNEHSETSAVTGNATDPTTPIQNKNKRNPDIKKFTKVLTSEEKAQQLQKKAKHPKTPSTKEIPIASPATNKPTPKSNIGKSCNANQTPVVKKRVPLLISVARGQSISTPDKNARISQFLKTINDAKQKEKQESDASTTPMETDDIVILD